jgi:L-ascorbate metabolism protein UlaG (beta-lactamase superfamily)
MNAAWNRGSEGMARRDVLRGMMALGGGLMLGSCTMATRTASNGAASARLSGGRISVRWLGGGVVELATPDGKQIAYGDAWVWNNTGWTRFSIPKPPEYASKEGFAQYVVGKKPEAVFVLLTHDHGDHIGDYFEMLKALTAAGVPVMTAGQSDLMRRGLADDFKANGLEREKIVVGAGNGMNFGGVVRHGAMTVRLVPAVHSNLHGFPAAGFMIDIGGVRVYISGDTDLFGDMKFLGERYQPNLAIVCAGDGPLTMGPQDAARACQLMGVSHAIPVHYAHNNLGMGTDAGEEFRRALAAIAPSVAVTVMKPGDTRTIET